ncbi:acetolactate synthase large subunit [Candidatus Poribacteria bacterium]|jgi:acetolactate synthase I/II/III large subunit|nr:acetolactate synthase large subunit [Candidatus Poribacteria bacterium]MBT5534991.1 acetolactate synthase large subunit [Candidatus Poribacteria bacterium]MBT7100332.1 acetolactate synthase large subunit [Candidatus Poribacteria bacterium]MBT7809530.1 acetolactate synthase large subunit [Candidatus Poribacteria bacterium]
MKASDLLVRCLEAEGVDTIFGVPGEENADLMMSLLDSSIEFVICRHEQAAAFMADMHGRLTGRPGVCLATLGPGASNLLTGVASANMDDSPLVAIIGQASTQRLHKESHQNMDAVAMFRPVTKWTSTIREPENINEVVHKAFKLAAAEKPGATVIELPEDIAKKDTDDEPIRARTDDTRAGAEPRHVEAALGLIEKATAPVILTGWGVIRTGAANALAELIGRTHIYAAQTFMGKGALSARDEHCLYCVGLGSRDIVLEAFEQADLVLCIGYDMVEWHPERWNIGADKHIVHIDTQPAEVDQDYNPDVEVVGDICAALEAINGRLTASHAKAPSRFADLRARMTRGLHEHDGDDAFPMKPQKMLSDLRAVMRDDDILLSDVGAHKMWVARHYPTYEPGTCFITNGFCSMGFALPGAIAAKRLHPDRNVVALCGDGGFLMNVQDLITAVRYETPITVLVWEDHKYGLIEWKQEDSFGKSSHIDLVNPDLIALAAAFGCQAIRVESVHGFTDALNEAFAETSRPTVIVAPVDYAENMKLTRRLGEIICR